jgi:hypothetical protein
VVEKKKLTRLKMALERTQAGPHALWTKKEAAAFYGVRERTIDRWLRSEELPAEAKVRIGGTVRFRSQILIDALKQEEGSN